MNQVIAVVLGIVLCCAFSKEVNINGDNAEFHQGQHLLGQKNRKNEESSKEVVENLLLKVFVVIDFSVYQSWLKLEGNDVDKTIANIRYFYAHLVNGISKKFASIDTGQFRYKVALSGYYIAQTLEQSSFTESKDVKTNDSGIIDFNKVLKNMETWIAERADVVKNYGVVTVFTKYNESLVVGRSNTKAACTGRGIAVVNSQLLSWTCNIAAHEIGHSLGSAHDGEGNDCDPKQHYLLTPKLEIASITNYHTFSECSRDSFEKYITSLNSVAKENCFRVEATPMDEEVKKYLAELPGQRFTPDQQCQQGYGMNTRYCPKGSSARLEICQMFSCLDSKTNKCFSNADDRSLEGTSCGNKSWCLNKQCVYDDRAPVKEEYCMFGDSAIHFTYNGIKYFCSDILKKPGLCNDNFIKSYCCKTCSNLANKAQRK